MFFTSNKVIIYKERRKMENRRRCVICIVDLHRASMQKHLVSEKQSENEKQKELILPEWLFKEKQAPNKKQN